MEMACMVNPEQEGTNQNTWIYLKTTGHRTKPIKNRGKMFVTLTSAMCLEHLKNFSPRSNKKKSSVMSCKNNSSNPSSELPTSILAAILKRLFSRPQSTASHLFARTRSFHRPVSFRPGQDLVSKRTE